MVVVGGEIPVVVSEVEPMVMCFRLPLQHGCQ